jgi:hypothetical protein
MLNILLYLNSYGEVRSPGYFQVYKDKKAALTDRISAPGSPNDPTAISIDLRKVVDFKVIQFLFYFNIFDLLNHLVAISWCV